MLLSPDRSFIRRAILVGLILASRQAVAQENLSVPVEPVNFPRAQDMMAMPGQAVVEPPQVTPAARMPQYQLHRSDSGTAAYPESPSIRFLLALPERPLLVEALVTIDGQPFAQAREQRIEKIMTLINDPDALRDVQVPLPPDAKADSEQQPPVSATPEVPAEPAPKSPDVEVSPPATATNAAVPLPEVKTKEPEVQAVAQYSAPSTIEERIRRHMLATGTKPSSKEVRWMLANLIDGPVLLFLNDNFQRTRAEQQPLFYVLDTNRDRVVSSEEIANAAQSLQECDLDRNDIVDSTEIAKVASDPRNRSRAIRASQPLVLRLDQATTQSNLLPSLNTIYGSDNSAEAIRTIDTNADGKLDESEQKSLRERPADLVLRLDLNTHDQAASRLSLVSATVSVPNLIETAVCSTNSILLSFPRFALELSSVQGPASDQISIGAVNDGYAMLPELDPNSDGRFTIRELRTLVDRLKAFDRDGDQSITKEEIFSTYRLCLGLGSHAHQPLSTLRRTNSKTVPDSTAPDWFTEMDKNRDRDLSRKEFPGTDEQFQQLDLDSDQLISASEADKAQS